MSSLLRRKQKLEKRLVYNRDWRVPQGGSQKLKVKSHTCFNFGLSGCFEQLLVNVSSTRYFSDLSPSPSPTRRGEQKAKFFVTPPSPCRKGGLEGEVHQIDVN